MGVFLSGSDSRLMCFCGEGSQNNFSFGEAPWPCVLFVSFHFDPGFWWGKLDLARYKSSITYGSSAQLLLSPFNLSIQRPRKTWKLRAFGCGPSAGKYQYMWVPLYPNKRYQVRILQFWWISNKIHKHAEWHSRDWDVVLKMLPKRPISI